MAAPQWRVDAVLEEFNAALAAQDKRAETVQLAASIFAAVASQLSIAAVVIDGVSSIHRRVVIVAALVSVVGAASVIVLDRRGVRSWSGVLNVASNQTTSRDVFDSARIDARRRILEGNEHVITWMYRAAALCLAGSMVTAATGLLAFWSVR
jgi:hypothetical protein